MQRRRTRTTAVALALGAVLMLGACKDDKGGASCGFNQSYKGEDGAESTVEMCNAVVPDDFPSDEIPLPENFRLQAVVTGKQPPNRFYSFTYALGGKSGVVVGREYRERLKTAGFQIKNPKSSSSGDGGFTTFDAIGRRWDLSVASGKGSPMERAQLSLQVTTHGSLDDANELLEDFDDNGSSVVDPDNPGDLGTTSTSSIPLDGG